MVSARLLCSFNSGGRRVASGVFLKRQAYFITTCSHKGKAAILRKALVALCGAKPSGATSQRHHCQTSACVSEGASGALSMAVIVVACQLGCQRYYSSNQLKPEQLGTL